MKTPFTVSVQLTSSPGVVLGDLIVRMSVRAGRKNPYSILFPKSDADGLAVLDDLEVAGQIADHNEYALMDYDGSMASADPVVGVELFDPTWLQQHKEVAIAAPLRPNEAKHWRSAAARYQYLLSCRNRQFRSDQVEVDIAAVPHFRLPVTPI